MEESNTRETLFGPCVKPKIKADSFSFMQLTSIHILTQNFPQPKQVVLAPKPNQAVSISEC